MVRLVTEDEAKTITLEHVRKLNREIERLEHMAQTREVELDWYRDNQERWRSERDAAVVSSRRAWRLAGGTVALVVAVLLLGC